MATLESPVSVTARHWHLLESHHQDNQGGISANVAEKESLLLWVLRAGFFRREDSRAVCPAGVGWERQIFFRNQARNQEGMFFSRVATR